MKKNFILVISILALTCFESYGQVYERIYSEANQTVQNKLNENKMNGLDILSSINAKHIVLFSGLTASQKTELESQLNAHADVLSFELSDDSKSLTVNSKATFSKEMLLEIIEHFQLNLVSYSAEFSVQQ